MSARIEKLEVHTVRVPLIRPFVTAVRHTDAIDAVLVEIIDSDGRHGWGEAAASWRVTGESPASIRAVVAGPLADVVLGRNTGDLQELGAGLARAVVHNSAARSAVDCALHDLAAQAAGLSMAAFLGGFDAPVRTDMTLSAGDTADLVGRGLEHRGNGFRTLKVKVGAGRDDADAVLAVRAAVGPQVALRVDANQGWDIEEAVRIITYWEDHDVNIEFVEQPVPADSFDALAEVTRRVNTPVLADESVWTVRDLTSLIERHATDLVNVKLAKTGGITGALELIRVAAANGVGVLVGCMMESHVGIAAAAGLARTLPVDEAARAHDLDAGLWLRRSPVRGGVRYRGDTLEAGAGLGLGIVGLDSAGCAA